MKTSDTHDRRLIAPSKFPSFSCSGSLRNIAEASHTCNFWRCQMLPLVASERNPTANKLHSFELWPASKARLKPSQQKLRINAMVLAPVMHCARKTVCRLMSTIDSIPKSAAATVERQDRRPIEKRLCKLHRPALPHFFFPSTLASTSVPPPPLRHRLGFVAAKQVLSTTLSSRRHSFSEVWQRFPCSPKKVAREPEESR